MSVTFVAERPDSPKATFTLGKFTVVRKFLVVTNNILDGPGTVALAPGLPKLFEPYQFGFEFLPILLCRSVEPERIAPNSLEWEVTCTYETPEPKDTQSDSMGGTDQGDGGGTGEENPQQFENPELMIPEIEIHFETHREVIYAVQGMQYGTGPLAPGFQPLTASNGEIYVPAPERDRSHMILTITRNENINANFINTVLTYQDAVNADVFWGAQPGQVKVQSITASRLVKNYPDGSILPYLKVTYVFHFRNTWYLQVLDKGTWYWITVNGQKRRKKFQTDDNQNVDGLLDGAGGALPQGSAPVFNTVQIYNMVPFAPLNLPQSFMEVQ